jgi:hypothetical protein
MVSGACLCGALRYTVEGPLTDLVHCHCSRCRKHHGAPFASFVAAQARGFRWLTGADHVQTYRSSPAGVRPFCPTCFAVAPTVAGETVYLPAGNLEDPLAELRAVHAYVGSKASWHTLADDLPRYDAAPPGRSSLEVEWPAPPTLASGVHGSCLCGDVRFAVEGRPTRFMLCHCSRCRRGRSAAHGANTFYPLAQFSWLAGQSQVRAYRLPEAARFALAGCVRCGSGAPVIREGVPFVLVPAGLLDGDPGLRPEAHIHVASGAAWYPFHDDLPQFAELPPA